MQDFRDYVLSQVAHHEPESKAGDKAVSNIAKQALAYAAEEAARLSDKHIRNQHLLLGLMRVESCLAAQLLQKKGFSYKGLRERVIEPSLEKSPGDYTSTMIWNSKGIPVGYGFERLLYNPASETLILQMGSYQRLSRLYMRHKDAESYDPIGCPEDHISYDSVVTCERQPLVVFNSWKFEEGGGAHWSALFSCNLKTNVITEWASEKTLIVEGLHKRAWISDLVSLVDDGQKLFMNIAIEKAIGSGSSVDYYLASITLPNNKVELLSPLRDTFF